MQYLDTRSRMQNSAVHGFGSLHSCRLPLGGTIPSPARAGISLGKQRLSSQNRGLLSSLCQGRLIIRGHLSDGRDGEGDVFSGEIARPKPRMAYIVGLPV